MFAFFKNLFKKEKHQVTASSLLGDDFDKRIKQMLNEVLSEQKERLNKDLREVLPGIKI